MTDQNYTALLLIIDRSGLIMDTRDDIVDSTPVPEHARAGTD